MIAKEISVTQLVLPLQIVSNRNVIKTRVYFMGKNRSGIVYHHATKGRRIRKNDFCLRYSYVQEATILVQGFLR